jgi:5-(carboxyamino)imidazole ribonucleotide synthase
MNNTPRFPLPPGSTIGIMGGGQLGRMAALAAAPLGYRCHIFTPETNSPAEQVSAAATIADYSDIEALENFADDVDVVTFEFENVPFESVQILAERVPVRPGWDVLRISQDRLVEKNFINSLDIKTTPYMAVRSLDELKAGVAEFECPCVLKTTRMGYDGKGQILIKQDMDLSQVWADITKAAGDDIAILEDFADLAMEVSVIVARGEDGSWVAYPPVDNRHANNILDVTRAPAKLPESLCVEAVDAALKIAENMEMVGLLAVEIFITNDKDKGGISENSDVMVNEIAPRPHNSGHWTQDACVTSQFEQFIRAVVGLPFGSVEHHHDAIMKNLIGDDVDGWLDYNGEQGAKLHLYGKAEARPGRKMGHVNRLYPLGHLPKE